MFGWFGVFVCVWLLFVGVCLWVLLGFFVVVVLYSCVHFMF